MINTITIDFWSLDIDIAKEFFEKISNIVSKRINNPFFIKIKSIELEFDIKKLKELSKSE